MARFLYAASPADYFIDAGGAPVPGARADVYAAQSGGVAITDLLDSSGTAATQVVADSFGGFRFSGPDGTNTDLWIQAPGGTIRYVVHPTLIGGRVAALEAGATTEAAARATGDTNTLGQAATDAASALTAHSQDPNAHPGYAVLRDSASGTVVGGTIWTGNTFPTAAQGAKDGDYLFFGG